MSPGPSSNAHLADSLHNAPGAYWCPDCQSFTLDCLHLVPPLDGPRVILNNWQIQGVGYDRVHRILELEMNTGDRYQFYGVSRELAIGLVKAAEPAQFHRERIAGRFRFARVRMRN